MSTKHSYLREEDYYESRSIGSRARSDKRCEHCGLYILAGDPHTVHIFYPEFTAYPTHNHCNDAFKSSLLTQKDIDEAKTIYEDFASIIRNAVENDEVIHLVLDNPLAKLQAVKEVKELLNVGLKMAKDIVDEVHRIYLPKGNS